MLPTWFIFNLLSLASTSGSEISQKISLTQKINLSAVTNNFIVWTLQGIGGFIIAFVLGQLSFTFPVDKLPYLIAVAIMYFLGGTFFYTSYKSNSPSVSIILGSISIIISTTLGIIFLKEPLLFSKFIGIALILGAIIALNYRHNERLEKHNLFALLGGICFGVAYTIDKSITLTFSPAMYVVALCFSVAIASLLFQGKSIRQEVKDLKRTHYYPMIFSAFFGTLFNFFTFTSYNYGGNVGVVDALNNSNVFLVILLEVVLLRDRKDLVKKIVCSVVAVAGLMILSTIK